MMENNENFRKENVPHISVPHIEIPSTPAEEFKLLQKDLRIHTKKLQEHFDDLEDLTYNAHMLKREGDWLYKRLKNLDGKNIQE